MATKTKDIIMNNKVYGWIALGTALILSIPFFAMQFSSEVDWKLGDFLIVGLLLFGSGALYVSIARNTSKKRRIYVAIAIATMALLAWVHIAVGIVDTWPLAGS